MKKGIGYVPFAAVTAFFIYGRLYHFELGIMRIMTLLMVIAAIVAIYYLKRNNQASPIHKGMLGFLVLACLSFWIWPHGADTLIAKYPAAALYAVLFIVAAGPPIIGREVFTAYFARKITPEAVWETDIFKKINCHLCGLWAVLFFLSFLSGMAAGILNLDSAIYNIAFEVVLPSALMLGVGLPVTKRYPDYYQRKLGLIPLSQTKEAPEQKVKDQKNLDNQVLTNADQHVHKKEEETSMAGKPTIVAVNGSPHAGVGNTSMMIEMLRNPLAEEGFNLEMIYLCEHDVDYCHGCGFCMEKGNCWIEDDHRAIAKRLFAADGIILASPVYILHVTAQMKTFLDRSLAYGHKPRPTWKPGLAVCVSAGLGETQTAEYLAGVLRVYGAFAVGQLTALAAGPGGFVGQKAVEARAHDLAHDLARAIKEKRRYPATDLDLRFYQFMGDLVKKHKDTVMKHDDNHWQKHGFYDGFENYIQQPTSKTNYDPATRDAWIKELIAQHKRKKKAGLKDDRKQPTRQGPQMAKSCAELLQMMPLGFNASEANGLEAIYQFEVSGAENFTAHLKITNGTCTYNEGPADKPNVTIKTPADVWLAISKGELDGQQAFMSGKYKVTGELSLLLKLNSLFSP